MKRCLLKPVLIESLPHFAKNASLLSMFTDVKRHLDTYLTALYVSVCAAAALHDIKDLSIEGQHSRTIVYFLMS